jgi:DNA repair exonuclease SbcCD ATPase subunit
MKPLYFRLKGFTGLKVGLMNIDELVINFEKGIAITRRLTDGTWETISEIKFNPFSKGIIAFQGDNGTGKSTIMDNLHPFLMVVGRDDKIQDHVYLRESEKEFISEQDGIRYRSLVLIDAQNKKAEAYLYKGKNNEPLNNGLLTSYREATEKVFGAEQIFATVLHSSRKLIPITQMKPADRKEIFYYYLGSKLSIFEKLEAIAKTRYDEAMGSLDKSRARVLFIEEQLGKLVSDDAIVSIKDKFVYQCDDRWRAIEKEIELIGERQSILESDKEILIKKSDELQKKIKISEEQLVAENYKLSLIDEVEKKIVELVKSQKVYRDKLELEKSAYASDTNKLNERKTELETEIFRKEQIIQNEEKIKNATEEIKNLRIYLSVTVLEARTKKAEIEKEISQLNSEYQGLKNQYDTSITEINTRYDKRISELEQEFKAKQSDYQLKLSDNKRTKNDIENKYQKLIDEEEKKFSNAMSEYSNQQQEIKKLELEEKAICKETETAENIFNQKKYNLIKENERVQKESKQIDEVPCSKIKECVDTCEFLHNARMNRDMIGTITSQQQQLQDEHIKNLAEITEREKSKESEIQNLKDKSVEPNRSVIDKVIKGLEEKRNDELSEALEPIYPDDKAYISSVNVQRLKKDGELSSIKAPEPIDTLVQELEISKQQEIINKEPQQKDQLENLEKCNWEALQKECDEATLILPEKKKALEEIKKQISETDERFTKTKNENEFNQSSLDLQLGQLRKQADRTQIQTTIASWEIEKKKQTSELEDNKIKLTNIAGEIGSLNMSLQTIVKFTEDKNKEEVEASKIERKVERLAFIREGLSKNGIPALIIHNTGLDVAQIANDFLRNTESGLRISFDTLKPTKNGYKESFEIPVYKNNQLIDIKNVNDGGTVYIDESINKAIGIYLTSSKYSNHKYQSEFSDEKDGALSENNKNLYLKLMQESLALSDRDHLFLVTHSDSIWKQINQRIHLYASGKIQVVN